MLVLSRKVNETVLIGDDISVTLLAIDGDKVKIGIDAPKSVKIYRDELVESTKKMNKQAINAPVVAFEIKSENRGVLKSEEIRINDPDGTEKSQE